MAVIETKYSVGDRIWHATIITERKQHACPDCLGSKFWTARSPAGGEFTFQCPRCSSRFMSERDLSLDYTAYVPSANKLTIGSVEFNSASGAYNTGARYMCVETGVGSGSVYNENDLFLTEREAMTAAQIRADASNAEVNWIVSQYNKSLEISDYKLDNAQIKIAQNIRSRGSSLIWNLEYLFSKVNELKTVDEIREAVEEYKQHDWSKDKTAASSIEAA